MKSRRVSCRGVCHRGLLLFGGAHRPVAMPEHGVRGREQAARLSRRLACRCRLYNKAPECIIVRTKSKQRRKPSNLKMILSASGCARPR
eukprot:COSAG02_NODE_39218_length_419_cov_1.609375_1_plen_88_part_10